MFKIAIIRAIPVTLFTTAHDPLVRAVFLVLCLSGIILGAFNILSKRPDGWNQFVKAAVYGIGAAVITASIADDRVQADALVARLEEFKQQAGSYPEKLDDLVPRMLPNIRSIGLGRPIYGKQADSYMLTYRNAWESSCAYQPATHGWTCGELR